LKYFILGAFSSSLFLFGSSILYGVSGTTNFEDLKNLFFLINSDYEAIYEVDSYVFIKHILVDGGLIQFALAFIFVSLLFKLAVVPFHLWSIDVYEGSPSSSTIFFAVVPKLAIFVLLIRIFYSNFFEYVIKWRYYMVIISIVTIIIGSFAGLEQKKLKSLLAYSSISHMGYTLIAFSTGTFEGVQMLFCYLFLYMIAGLCIWSIFLMLRLKYKYIKKQNKELADLDSLGKRRRSLYFIIPGPLMWFFNNSTDVARCATNGGGSGVGSSSRELSVAPDYPRYVPTDTSLGASGITSPFPPGDIDPTLTSFVSQWEGLHTDYLEPDTIGNTIIHLATKLSHVLRVDPTALLVVTDASPFGAVPAGRTASCIAIETSVVTARVGGNIIEGFAPSVSDLLVFVNASAHEIAGFLDLINSIADPALDVALNSFLPQWDASVNSLCAACEVANPADQAISLATVAEKIAVDFSAVLDVDPSATLVVLGSTAAIIALIDKRITALPGLDPIVWADGMPLFLVAVQTVSGLHVLAPVYLEPASYGLLTNNVEGCLQPFFSALLAVNEFARINRSRVD
jgi:hypothetical protein